MSKELVICERMAKGVVKLILNDPDSRNAMSDQMAEQFEAHVCQLKQDKKLRVLILTGAGKAFSGGGHLEMLFEKIKKTPEENRQGMERFYQQFLSFLDLDVPVIAAINGHAVGAGLCFALACDIRIAVSDAKLGLNFVKLGLHPGMGATYFLPRLLGYAKAAELLFTASIITAEQAFSIGLLNQVVSQAKFQESLDQIVDNITTAGPIAMRQLKNSLRLNNRNELGQCLKREAQCQAENYASAEFVEGITAAKEKRQPEFKDPA